jgi:hypothetical protein
MKKFLLMLVCVLNLTTLYAQSSEKIYVYGIDYSYAKVYAAEESAEQFSKAFESINMLIVSEPKKFDFSRIFRKKVEVVIEPMLKVVSSSDYSDLITLNSTYENPQYSEIIKKYELPQTEGIGAVLVAKLLDKPHNKAHYELITFDIATREILSQKEVSGKAGGFGLRNYWAGSVYKVIKSTKLH